MAGMMVNKPIKVIRGKDIVNGSRKPKGENQLTDTAGTLASKAMGVIRSKSKTKAIANTMKEYSRING